MTSYYDQFINNSPLTETSTQIEINFKSHRDAKSTIVKLEWISDSGIRKSVQKAFNTVEVPSIIITNNESWMGESIPTGIEITFYLQSVNGIYRSQWSSPQRVIFTGSEVPVPEMEVGFLLTSTGAFIEFPDAE